MTTENIKKFRDIYRGKRPITIEFDNSKIIHDGLPGQCVIWDDTKERIICIRESVYNQHNYPWDIMMSGYEHIQFMSVAATIDDVKTCLDGIGYSKTKDMIDYLLKQPVAKSSITGSTGDGIDWSVSEAEQKAREAAEAAKKKSE